MAYSTSHFTFTSCSALPVRRAALGSQILAGGDQVYFSGGHRPRVVEAPFHPKSCHALACGIMDVPLPVYGANLFSSRDSCHFVTLGIFATGRQTDLDRRCPGIHLVRVESC